MDARCTVVSTDEFNYVKRMWDEILDEEGLTRYANERCFFSELVYWVAGRDACVTGDPEIGCEEKWIKERKKIKFVTYRGDVWD